MVLVVGGVIPDADVAELQAAGVDGVFHPATTIDEIVRFIHAHVRRASAPRDGADAGGRRVAGVGMHAFGRFPDASLKDLARVAIVRALDDAGLGVKDVEAVYSANALAGVLQGQEQIRGQSVLRDVGIERVPVVNVENACAGGVDARSRQGVMAIRAGAARVVLAVGFEKMFVGDTGPSLDGLESAADLEVIAGLGLQFTAIYAMRLRKRIDAGALDAPAPARRRGQEPPQRLAEPLRPAPQGVHRRGDRRIARRSPSR